MLLSLMQAGKLLKLCYYNLFLGLDTCSLDEQQAFVDCGLTYQSCLGGSGVELGTGSPQTLEISSYADVSACVCEFSKACLASSQCQVGTRGAACHKKYQCIAVDPAFAATNADCRGPCIDILMSSHEGFEEQTE